MSASSTMSRGSVADGALVVVGWSPASSSDWMADDVDSVDCDCIDTSGRGDAMIGDFLVGGDEQVGSPPTRTSGWVAARANGDGPPAARDEGEVLPRDADCSDGELPLRINVEHKPDVCISASTTAYSCFSRRIFYVLFFQRNVRMQKCRTYIFSVSIYSQSVPRRLIALACSVLL